MMTFKKCIDCVENKMPESFSLRKVWELVQCIIKHYGSMSSTMGYEEFTIDSSGEYELQDIEDFVSIINDPTRYIMEGEGQEKKYNRGDFSIVGNTITTDPLNDGQRWSLRLI